MARDRRWEVRLTRAMPTMGAVMTFVSVIAFLVVGVLVVDTLLRRPAAAVWLLTWCMAAFAVAVRNAMKSIETMNSRAWRSMARVALASGLIALAYPGWWLR